MKEGRTNRPNLDGEELAAIFKVAAAGGNWKKAHAAVLQASGRRRDQKTERIVLEAAKNFINMTSSELRNLSDEDASRIANEVKYDVSLSRIRSLARDFASWKQEGDDSTKSKLRHRAVERHQDELLNIAGGLRNNLRVPRVEDAAFVIPYGYGTDTYKWKSDDEEALIGWQYNILGPNTIKSSRGINVEFQIESSPLFSGFFEHLIAEGLEGEFFELKVALRRYAALSIRQKTQQSKSNGESETDFQSIRTKAEGMTKNLTGHMQVIFNRGYLEGNCQICP